MGGLQLTPVPFEGELDSVLSALPTRAGIGQILGDGDRNLVIGRAANLRRWAGGHLGQARPRKGARPRTDLRPVAREIRFVLTTSEFHQRLLFERVMARYVPPSARRDLKPPIYLRLDPGERFPRVTLASTGPDTSHLYGPFRDRRAAARVVDALHKRFPLRPCDYVFEPDPALPLGLGCLFAQVRTCAAPCLVRIREEDYRGLAEQAALFLARPRQRTVEAAAWLPSWVAARAGNRSLVIEATRQGIELYPVRQEAVLEGSARRVPPAELEETVRILDWELSGPIGEDAAWLGAWLHSPRRKGTYLVLAEEDSPAEIAAAVRRLLAPESMAQGTEG